MKKFFAFFIACLLLLLPSCAKAPAEPAVTATTAPTVPTKEATKPTNPTTPKLALPWDFPEVEPMTYEEYFSEKRAITETFNKDEVDNVRGFETLPEKIRSDCEWNILSKDKAFGVRDRKTVVMLDFRTMEKTDLYTQEDGIIYSEMLYADYRLLYFVAGTKDGNFLYRMYLPEKKLDCMTDQVNVFWLDWDSFDLTPLDAFDSRNTGRGDELFCTDNQSVCWEEVNPDYWEHFRERWAEEYPKLEDPEDPDDKGRLRDLLREQVHWNDYLCPMNRFRTDGKTITQEKTEDWIGPADAEAVAEIQKLFDQDSPWYRYLANCNFSQADLLNVSDLFGQGDYPVVSFTEDMRAGLEALGYEDVENLTLMHVSAEEVEQVLQEYMGVTLEDTMGMAEDPNGGYLAVKRDSCWNFHLSSGSVFYDSSRLYVTGTVESNEGTLTVHMNLKKVDGAWLVRSGFCY